MQGGFENLRTKKGAIGAFRYLSSLVGYGEERHQLKVEDYSELEGAILELRRDKPEYTQAEIARKLGCDAMRVSRTLKKYGKNK